MGNIDFCQPHTTFMHFMCWENTSVSLSDLLMPPSWKQVLIASCEWASNQLTPFFWLIPTGWKSQGERREKQWQSRKRRRIKSVVIETAISDEILHLFKYILLFYWIILNNKVRKILMIEVCTMFQHQSLHRCQLLSPNIPNFLLLLSLPFWQACFPSVIILELSSLIYPPLTSIPVERFLLKTSSSALLYIAFEHLIFS